MEAWGNEEMVESKSTGTTAVAERERWKTIPGYPNYQASTLGRIRSVPRVLKAQVHGGRDRYAGLRLTGADGIARKLKVHRLVLSTFYPNDRQDLFVLHSDGNPTNNKLSNLRWGTRLENAADAKRHGTTVRKLTLADRAEIRRLRASTGESYEKIGARFGVTSKAAWMVVRRYGSYASDPT